MLETIIDISHHNGRSPRFDVAAKAGVVGVIHKTTQGVHNVDPMLKINRQRVADHGLRFGGYHFGDGSDGAAQAQHFLRTLDPDKDELLCLDFETNPAGSTMTLEEARAFVTFVHDHTGRWPVLYSGHDLKRVLNGRPDPILRNCPLWLAQYGPAAVAPPGWRSWSMWQFTDGSIGSPPAISGIGHCDRSRFNGDHDDLKAFWAGPSRH